VSVVWVPRLGCCVKASRRCKVADYEIRKVCSLKKLVLAGRRGGRVALSENTPLGYMDHKLFVRAEEVVEGFCSERRLMMG
jgi:hypothetical protein